MLNTTITDEERAYLDAIPVASWLVGNVEGMLEKLRTHWLEVIATGISVHIHDDVGYVRVAGQIVSAPIAHPETGEFSAEDYQAVLAWMAEIKRAA